MPCAYPGVLLQSHGHPRTILPALLTDLVFHCVILTSTRGRVTGQLSTEGAWHWFCRGRGRQGCGLGTRAVPSPAWHRVLGREGLLTTFFSMSLASSMYL